jgi:hypothetical protein
MENQVNFSTSSSDDRGRRRSTYSLELACVLLCTIVFALLTSAWLLTARSISWRFRPLAAEVSQPPSPAWYLAYFNGDVEHFSVYDNLDGAAEALNRADVLFLGNSRMQYAFRNRDVLRRFFYSRGLTYFVLAFGYEEGGIFPEAIIRKFNLHPKWVIVNADPFFGLPLTAVSSRAMSFGYLEAWKSRFEAVSSLAVQRSIHRIFPYFALSQWDVHPQWIYYRAKSDGTLRLGAWRGTPGAIVPGNGAAGPPPSPGQVKEAEGFKKELEARGAQLVLTWIPPSSGDTARYLASALQVPLVAPEETGLATIDGSHLDEESCTRFSTSFLAAFGRITGAGADACLAHAGSDVAIKRESSFGPGMPWPCAATRVARAALP